MTTAELYQLHGHGASSAAIGPDVRITFWSRDDVLVAASGTEETLAHLRAMRELAALSRDSDSLERGLADEINRNAWGIREA